MNSLTVALAALGGVVLAGVVAHGAWQARKAGPRRAAIDPAAPRPDPIEPVLGSATARNAAELPAAGSEPRPPKRPSM
ncbi:MAG TPA: cell division protein FtsZ, partial [Albitalea sp.]|nr:cell division protein FtsZ [Albitalea sp.]